MTVAGIYSGVRLATGEGWELKDYWAGVYFGNLSESQLRHSQNKGVCESSAVLFQRFCHLPPVPFGYIWAGVIALLKQNSSKVHLICPKP